MLSHNELAATAAQWLADAYRGHELRFSRVGGEIRQGERFISYGLQFGDLVRVIDENGRAGAERPTITDGSHDPSEMLLWLCDDVWNVIVADYHILDAEVRHEILTNGAWHTSDWVNESIADIRDRQPAIVDRWGADRVVPELEQLVSANMWLLNPAVGDDRRRYHQPTDEARGRATRETAA